MDTNANKSANKGMDAMRAALARLTPEQRRENARKAAEASKRAREQAAQAVAAGASPAKGAGRERLERVVDEARFLPDREWRVALASPDTGAVEWVCVSAPGMQRAGKLARKAHPGKSVAGVLLAAVSEFPQV